MRWPWKRQGSKDRLVVSWSGQTLAYVLARASSNGKHKVLKFGVERQGNDSTDDFVHRLQGLGLKGLEAFVMLRPEQCQLLQIDAPAVPPEELRAAARYQIKEMLDSHLDDVTLDVMRVGDGKQKGTGALFVVVATNAVVREVLDLADAMGWKVPVIDIYENAQRNLQNALTKREGHIKRANAALVLVEGQQAVLTISANGELFYSRRFELPDGFLTAAWTQGSESAVVSANAFTPVDEYVPDYSVGGVSYGNDYTNMPAASSASAMDYGGDEDKAQRFLLEVQRTLDVWSRSWSSMPLFEMRVYAGERSVALSKWLSRQLGQPVQALNVDSLFTGFEGGALGDVGLCLPLLGIVLRTESRQL